MLLCSLLSIPAAAAAAAAAAVAAELQ